MATTTSREASVAAAVRLVLPLPLLERPEDDADARRWFLASVAAGVDGAEDDDDELRFALRQPPPTGTLRRTPPLVLAD